MPVPSQEILLVLCCMVTCFHPLLCILYLDLDTDEQFKLKFMKISPLYDCQLPIRSSNTIPAPMYNAYLSYLNYL